MQGPFPRDTFKIVQYKAHTTDKRAVGILMNAFLLLFAIVKEEDLTLFAEEIRAYTKQAMKIEVAPWIRDYVVDMEELYSELTLEKIQNKAYGPDGRVLGHYREMFGDLRESKHEEKQQKNSRADWFWVFLQVVVSWFYRIFSFMFTNNTPKVKVSRQVTPGNRILIKGDPGMGKTTLGKKLAWDWATGQFAGFSLVLLVVLKLVRPWDLIEDAIIAQIYALQGLNVTVKTLDAILKTFGNKCLLILDGLDENASGQNGDVMKIILRAKFYHTNVFITSRPHTTRPYEKQFSTIVKVEGFTYKEASKFAMKILLDEQKVQALLSFNPADYATNIPLYKSPILLSFLCLLVREDDIDLSSHSIDTGEIYARMLRCLYKKFTIRKGIEFKASEFVRVMKLVGKLAFETLVTGKSLLQRSEVIEEVGSEAFDYGLLIGHEDFRLIRGESEDILVTFPHRSIQEFLGSLYFVLMLIEGVSYKTLLGKHSQRPIFMMNPLFLQFCMWLLHSDKGHFSLQNTAGSFRPARFVCGAKNCFRGVNHPECPQSLPCA